ncbi:MAG TPA: hypothetical protein VM364_08685 [Vicinamibacterales bacterium]|nr:hypothetical protein [Vicinamibacterales bacterium]
MKHFRLIVPGLALAAMLAAASLPGRAQQPAAAPGNPFDALYFRSIGPATMSGRIADLAVYEANPALFYVATAHGGVWKTVNNGTTWEAQFQDMGHMSTGAIAVSQSNPDLVWLGTGEASNRQSKSWGDGVYKSTDGGRTWTNMGLKTSRHINRIVIDPRHNDTVFVAATGSVWGPGGERGVFKTTDGGRTWKQVLKVDDDTGANEVVMDPTNSQVLYATMYQRRRTACCFNGGGPGSGIFKSTDGGETWTKLKGGVLDGPLGRIAVDVYRKRPNILYALIEGPAQPGGRGGAAAGGMAAGRGGQQQLDPSIPTGMYRSDDAGATWRKVNNANPRPMYFSQINIDPNDPDVVYTGGVGLHQTLDGGKTIATDIAASTHDDVHAIWINPSNSSHVLIGNDGGLAISYDRGKNWKFVPNLPLGLFYHVSVDNAVPFNICGGLQDNYNWCGPSAVRSSAGIGNHEWNTLLGGDGFVVLQDPTDYRIVFTESQDGNLTRVDRVTFETMSIRPTPPPGEPAYRWHWDTPLMFSPHDHKVLYTAANKVFRSADRGLSWTVISDDLTSGQNRDEIETMGVKNSEIRFSRNDGIANWPAITSLAESPKRAGLLYAGTDDGNVSVTRDGGKTWTRISDRFQGLPKGIFVSELVPSRFDEGTVYATFDGHRQNDFETWIYVSNDFGQTWRSLNGNLSGQVARTLLEDLKNPDVLYLGTETGILVTLDRGASWMRMKGNMPTVRVDEMVIHPRDNALVVGTHGRSLFVLDNLSPVQEMAAAQKSMTEATLFSPAPSAMYRRPARDRNYEFWGDQTFFGENPPAAAVISWYLKKDVGSVALRISDAAGREIREISGDVLAKSNTAGIQAACWDMRVQPVPNPDLGQGRGQGGGRQGGPQDDQPQQQQPVRFGAGCTGGGGGFGGFGGGGGGNPGPWVLPGTYTVSLIVDGKTVGSKPLRVVGDPDVVLTQAERKRLYDMAMELHDLQRRANTAISSIASLRGQMEPVAKQVSEKADLPADVKAQFESFNKDVTALATRLIPAQGGRGFGGGGGRGGAPEPSPIARAAQAKNGLMGGMWPTQATFNAYNEAKTGVPAAIGEMQSMLGRAQALSAALARHGITLTVPATAKIGTSELR